MTPPAAVVMMCGLPASGKTTTAGRLHAHAGGVLIRSCDVYARLGIDLPDWVARTRGFTVNVGRYDRVRDHAYVEIARGLEAGLEVGGLVVLDAVYGESAKRAAVYAICRARGAALAVCHCRCDDPDEVARRLDRRRGRERVPEHEASDRSVWRDIARRWEDPHADRFTDDGGAPAIVTVDTLGEARIAGAPAASWSTALVRAALAAPAPGS
jgi:predicted kinase